MTIQIKLGRAIVLLRRKNNISQENLALEAGIDRKYMSDIENGKRNVSIEVIQKIANTFEMSISQLMKCVEEYNGEE